MFYIVCRTDFEDKSVFSIVLNTYSDSEELYDAQRYDVYKGKRPCFDDWDYPEGRRLYAEEMLAYNYGHFFGDYEPTDLFTGGWDEVRSRLVRNERLSADRS